MSLFFNMLSRLVITFLPRSKHLLIPWLQSPSAMILEPPKIKSVTVSTVSPSICHEVMGPDAMILFSWMLTFKPTFHSSLSLSSTLGWPKSLFEFFYLSNPTERDKYFLDMRKYICLFKTWVTHNGEIIRNIPTKVKKRWKKYSFDAIVNEIVFFISFSNISLFIFNRNATNCWILISYSTALWISLLVLTIFWYSDKSLGFYTYKTISSPNIQFYSSF